MRSGGARRWFEPKAWGRNDGRCSITWKGSRQGSHRLSSAEWATKLDGFAGGCSSCNGWRTGSLQAPDHRERHERAPGRQGPGEHRGIWVSHEPAGPGKRCNSSSFKRDARRRKVLLLRQRQQSRVIQIAEHHEPVRVVFEAQDSPWEWIYWADEQKEQRQTRKHGFQCAE